MKKWYKRVGSDLDGIIAKRLDMPYRSGERDGMQKIKQRRTADCVVGGFRWHKDGEGVGSLMLGTENYSRNELLALLNDANEGDVSVRLARQLLAAKLNIPSGAATEPIANVMLQADLQLGQHGGRLPYGILPTAVTGPSMVTAAELLDTYNRGLVTPYCSPATPNEDADDDVAPQTVIIEGPVTSVNGNIIRS